MGGVVLSSCFLSSRWQPCALLGVRTPSHLAFPGLCWLYNHYLAVSKRYAPQGFAFLRDPRCSFRSVSGWEFRVRNLSVKR